MTNEIGFADESIYIASLILAESHIKLLIDSSDDMITQAGMESLHEKAQKLGEPEMMHKNISDIDQAGCSLPDQLDAAITDVLSWHILSQKGKAFNDVLTCFNNACSQYKGNVTKERLQKAFSDRTKMLFANSLVQLQEKSL